MEKKKRSVHTVGSLRNRPLTIPTEFRCELVITGDSLLETTVLETALLAPGQHVS